MRQSAVAAMQRFLQDDDDDDDDGNLRNPASPSPHNLNPTHKLLSSNLALDVPRHPFDSDACQTDFCPPPPSTRSSHVFVDRFSACVQCRKRKIRCEPSGDSEQQANGGACGTCVRRGKACHWLDNSSQTRAAVLKRPNGVAAEAAAATTEWLESSYLATTTASNVRRASRAATMHANAPAKTMRKRAHTHDGRHRVGTADVRPRLQPSMRSSSFLIATSRNAAVDMDADGEIERDFLAPDLMPHDRQFDLCAIAKATTAAMQSPKSTSPSLTFHNFGRAVSLPTAGHCYLANVNGSDYLSTPTLFSSTQLSAMSTTFASPLQSPNDPHRGFHPGFEHDDDDDDEHLHDSLHVLLRLPTAPAVTHDLHVNSPFAFEPPYSDVQPPPPPVSRPSTTITVASSQQSTISAAMLDYLQSENDAAKYAAPPTSYAPASLYPITTNTAITTPAPLVADWAKTDFIKSASLL